MPKKRRPPPPKKLPYKGWTPTKDGVTQSLLQKFMGCKDRFHKHAVSGLRVIDRKEAMEYGTIFHRLIELGSTMGDKYTREKLMREMSKWMTVKYPSPESLMLCRIAIAQYHEYRVWESKKPKYKVIEAEPVFKEHIKLPPVKFNPNECININIPSGVTIPLRGRIDEILEINNGLWVQENKTKSRIDITFLQETVPENIQVMFYAVCAELKYQRPCRGVIYNIIRKPALRQKQKESDSAFIERVRMDISEQHLHYFTRLQYEFQAGQVQSWIRHELIPALYSVYLWWKSIEANPTNPWVDVNGNVNPFHGRRPFGVYDSMTNGKGAFYDLIVNGRKHNLTVSEDLFPELSEDEDD